MSVSVVRSTAVSIKLPLLLVSFLEDLGILNCSPMRINLCYCSLIQEDPAKQLSSRQSQNSKVPITSGDVIMCHIHHVFFHFVLCFIIQAVLSAATMCLIVLYGCLFDEFQYIHDWF